MILKAIYKIGLPIIYPLIVKPKNENDNSLIIDLIQGPYQIRLQLFIDNNSEIKPNNKKYMLYFVYNIEICISSPENEIPPPHDDINYPNYFEKRSNAYQAIAVTTFERLINFFRYKLGNSLPQDILAYTYHFFDRAIWEDGDENRLDPKSGTTSASCRISRHYDLFGIKNYDETEHGELLKEAVMDSFSVHLYEEILVDARNAIVDENYRRGILEMAIACEIYVKNTFFRTNDIARAVFEYLEGKGEIEINVLKLLDGVSKHAFGKSFKDLYPKDYENIVYLFRTRNKIAHQGECYYKNDKGVKKEIYSESGISEWWSSIQSVISWLSREVDALLNASTR